VSEVDPLDLVETIREGLLVLDPDLTVPVQRLDKPYPFCELSHFTVPRAVRARDPSPHQSTAVA
jgi:hypothetical protein